MNIIIATRSCNHELYAKAQAFWPTHIPRHRVQDMDGFHAAADYLWLITQLDADFVVNCDEDCFITDWNVVIRLLGDMQESGAAYAGMPDTKEHCHHRNNGPFVHNPFFTVFASARIRAVLHHEPYSIVNPDGCPVYEPFNNFYKELSARAPGIDLAGHDHADGISTVLSYLGEPFAAHSWYSRDYDSGHRERIDALHRQAQEFMAQFR